MAYPTTNAQAMYGNISKIAQSFMPMFDPETQARAAQFRQERELFPLRKRGLEADLGLTEARTGTEGYQQQYLDSQTGLVRSKTAYQDTMNDAQGALYRGGPMPVAPAPQAAAGPFPTINAPVTSYSTAAAVGGPDEMQDSWTNKGYSATGQNLVPGMAAVNTSVHPLGTVFRDPATGETFIAGDKHGNSDPSVIDLFQSPDSYSPQKKNRQFEVVGREKIPYGTTGPQIQEILAGYQNPNTASDDLLPPLDDSNLPPDAMPVSAGPLPQQAAMSPQDAARLAAVAGLNPEIFMGGQSRAEAMAGGFDESRGRELALAQGLLPSQTTAITPEYQTGRDQSAQAADLAQATQVAGINGMSSANVADINGRYDLAGDSISSLFGGASTRSASGGSMPLMPGAPRTFSDMNALEKEATGVGFQAFGVPMDEAGNPTNDPYVNERRLWQDSYIEARKQGMSQNEAVQAANQHHFNDGAPAINSEDTFAFGFGKDPSLPAMNRVPLEPAMPQAPGAPAGQDIGAAISGIMQAFGLGGQQPQQAPIPVTGAEVPPQAQEAPVPATGPMPAGRPMGSMEQEQIASNTAAEGSAFNDKSLSVLRMAVEAGASLEDLAATAFSGTPENEAYLEKVLQGQGGLFAPSPQDIRNALMDANAMQRAGIDPAVIRQYIPQGRGGSGAPAASSNPAVDELLNKYR